MNDNPNFITVRIERNYGNPTIYPMCDKAKLFAEIADTKTLTPRTVNAIKHLGYEVRVLSNVTTL